jgi:hypothetical protein
MIARAVVVTILSVSAVSASGQVPVPVVERTVTRGELATRVSLFSNQVVVVTTRYGDEQVFARRITLPDDEYVVYLATFESNAQKLDERPITSQVSTSNAEVVLRLHVGPDTPRSITFSPMSGVKLPLANIMLALDDLEQLVFEMSPSAEELRTWEPQKGDRVELLNGHFATVVEAWEDGLLFLEHDQTYVREAVPPEARDQVILRVLEPEQ